MKRKQPSTLTSLIAGIALLMGIVSSGLLTTGVSAASGNGAQKVADNLLSRMSHQPNSDDQVSIILQVGNTVSGPLKSLLNRNGVHVNKQFKNFNSYAIELPLSAVAELAEFDEVSFVSL